MADLTLEESLILEQYRTVRTEIVARIQEHYRLWLLKLGGTGVIFSFALTTTNQQAKLGLVLIPFLAMIIDGLIVNNLSLVGGLGNFVSEVIELGHGVPGWDTKSLKTGYFGYKKKQWLNDWIIISFSTLGLFAIAGYLLFALGLLFRWHVAIVIITSFVLVLGHVIKTWRQLVRVRPSVSEPIAVPPPTHD